MQGLCKKKDWTCIGQGLRRQVQERNLTYNSFFAFGGSKPPPYGLAHTPLKQGVAIYLLICHIVPSGYCELRAVICLLICHCEPQL